MWWAQVDIAPRASCTSSNFLKQSFFCRFRQLARRVSKGWLRRATASPPSETPKNSVSGAKRKQVARSSVGSVRKSTVVGTSDEPPAIAVSSDLFEAPGCVLVQQA